MEKPVVMGMRFIMAACCLCFWAADGTAQARSISPLPEDFDIRQLRGNNGTTYYILATGTDSGPLWGTGVYTDDSSLGKAAMHAGVLGPGEQGVVKVTVLPGQESYQGSSAHGVTSDSYGSYSGSFSVGADDGGNNPPLPDPVSLEAFRGNWGAVYLFDVTGDGEAGSVWGTNVYTDDSRLAAAAVHAGVLAWGQRGTVRVTLVPGQSSYVGCVANRVESNSYGEYDGSYAVSDVAGVTPLLGYPGSPGNPLPDPGNLTAFRGRDGAAVYFSVTGTIEGSLWGTGVYTDDSDLSAAAVHSGVLLPGRSGTVKVTILPGQSGYTGSTAHNVTSNSYGSFPGSYSVAAPDGQTGTIPVLTSPSGASAAPGMAFSYTIQATNSPWLFNATGLPAGLSVDAPTGIISGIPELSGTFMVQLLAQNNDGVGAATLRLQFGVADCLFHWVETSFPTIFYPAVQTGYAAGYTYRYYTGLNIILAAYTDDHLYVYAPDILGDRIEDLGPLSYWVGMAGCY